MSNDRQSGPPQRARSTAPGRSKHANLDLAGSRLPDDTGVPNSASGSNRRSGEFAPLARRTPTTRRDDQARRNLERKLSASRWSILFQQAMPRFWLLLGIAGLFVLVSMLGVWQWLGPLTHKTLLAVFAVALLAALMFLARLRWPGREEALRRIERISGVKHRPASSYEDRITGAGDDPVAQTLWRAHKQRLAKMIGGLRVGLPQPRTDRHDPFALRALLLLGVLISVVISGDSAADRLRSAFHFGPATLGAEARLDVWATPPAYTAKPPVMLSDGSSPAGSLVGSLKRVVSSSVELPEQSVLIVRLSGTDPSGLALEIIPEGGGKTERITVKALELVKEEIRADKAAGRDADDGAAGDENDTRFDNTYSGDVGELRYMLKTSARVRVMSGRSEVASYSFKVIPDQPPSIALLKLPKRSRRGALKLRYKMADDYGIAGAEAQFTKLPEPKPDPARAWARKPVKTGARPPLERPPLLKLSLPRASSQKGKAKSSHELAKHPWAGRRVAMKLIIRDHAGRKGESETVEMALPERQFRNALARAIIEQRRDLLWDPRSRPDVLDGLNAISVDPQSFIKSKGAYLGLRSAWHRLRQSSDRATRDSVAEQLWNVAVRIEDGNLTDAQRRLRDAQDKLAKALENGASEKELANLMKELRQALSEYMKQLAERAPKQQQNPNGKGKDQFITSKDFEQMLRDMEKMARSGNRDAAQQMLSEMRDLLDRLQSGRRANNGKNRRQQQMMKMMDEFGDLIGKQQKLLDDTFKQDQQQGSGEQQQSQRQQGQQGKQPSQQGQQQGEKGQRGQNGKNGEGKGGQRAGREPGPGQLGDRQGQLRGKLDRLTEQMKQFGLNPPDQLGKAGKSMDGSKQALGRGNLGEGMRQERRALEQLRQGAQSMAEQMLSQMARRYGMQRGQRPQSMDPLGRPRNRASNESGGTELDSRVKIPDQFRAQRSRQILEELRRRLGESTRPTQELDYLERLLKKF